MRDFEDYLCSRNDLIYNAAHQLICALTAKDHQRDYRCDASVPEWNMELIGAICDAAKAIIQRNGRYACHPYFCEENPCYLVGDCSNPLCSFKTEVAAAKDHKGENEV